MADHFYSDDEIEAMIEAGHITPDQVPRHIGGDQGTMEGRIAQGSEAVQQSGHGNYGNRGTEIYDEAELPGTNDKQGQGEYGSATVIDLNQTETLEPELDPNIAKPQRTAAQILAEMRQRRQQQ